MKTTVLALLFVCLIAPAVSAQSKIKQKDLKGTWKLVFDIDKEEGENMIERAALGAVDGLLSSMDISFQFKKDNELKVTVYVFGEEEVEYSNWEFAQDGGIYIGDNEHLQMEDTVWYLDGERLIAWDRENGDWDADNAEVYLQKVH